MRCDSDPARERPLREISWDLFETVEDALGIYSGSSLDPRVVNDLGNATRSSKTRSGSDGQHYDGNRARGALGVRRIGRIVSDE